MSNRTIQVDDRLHAYLLANSLREPKVLAELREATASLGSWQRMQISPEQGQFMALLVQLMGAKRLLEVGTFTGYSALACALALPSDGQLIACDVNEEWTAMAQTFWQKAGVAERIVLKLGPAQDTLKTLITDGQSGSFDMMFIDADKTGYDAYYELGLELLRPGGLILIDNVLWSGDVANPAVGDPDTVALRQLNQKLLKDERIDLSMLPIGDGLTMARKRP